MQRFENLTKRAATAEMLESVVDDSLTIQMREIGGAGVLEVQACDTLKYAEQTGTLDQLVPPTK